jgi:hypothetical protein
MLKKISIHIKNEFADHVWKLIFNLYDFCHGEYSNFGEKDFDTLNASAHAIRYHEDVSPVDAIAVYGKVLDYPTLITESSHKTEFFISVVYIKSNTSIGDPNLLPLISWLTSKNTKNEHTDFSFGVDISGINEKSKNRYIYTTGQRLSIIDEWPVPRASNRCVYYINEKNGSKFTRNFPYSRSRNAPGSGKSLLLPIDKTSLDTFFSSQKKLIRDNYGQTLLIKSIESFKINVNIDETHSFIEKWLVNAYLTSLNNKDETIDRQYKETKDTLHEYCNNIYELVQNIIFHTKEKTGWLSMGFYKKSDIRDDLRKKIPSFDKYSDNDRFFEFELSDNGKIGIVDTFYEEYKENILKDNDKIEIADSPQLGLNHFFNPKEILPDNNIQLTLRYVAHLGIKTFVSSVISNGGYFYVETNQNNHKKISLESEKEEIAEPIEVEGDYGTVYKVVLPVKKRPQPISAPTRSSDDRSRKEDSKEFNPKGVLLNSLLFDATEIRLNLFEKASILNKEDQNFFIYKYGEQLIDQIKAISAANVCVDTSFSDMFSPNFIFKLIAYVRLNLENQQQPRTIVCYNLKDNVFNRLEELSINQTKTFSRKNQEVWSEKYITILISDKLQILSLSGATKDSFCYINHELRKYYSNALKNTSYVFSSLSNERKEALNKFIQHYEIEAAISSHVENQVLVHPIEDATTNDIGCVVKIPARLGEKIYIDEFYQADHLFLNGFYATKFAICVARNIVKQFKGDNRKKRVVLLGYHQYSKLLVDCISKLLTEYTKQCSDANYFIEKIVIGYEDKDEDKDNVENKESNELTFDIIDTPALFTIAKDSEMYSNNQQDASDATILITIVPIATTLTTFDKLISCFKQKIPSYSIDYEYNHCTILVRDSFEHDELSSSNGQTKMESEWGWTGVNESDRTISVGERTIHYLSSRKTKWHRLIDEYTFPHDDFSNEKFIVRTRNSSLNVYNLLGYPQMSIPPDKNNKESLPDYYKFTGGRLKDMKDFIHFGHLEQENKHYRYYFDIPGYIIRSEKRIQMIMSRMEQNRQEKLPKLYNWVVEYLKKADDGEAMHNIGGKLRDKEASINVIVTSEPDKNPYLTSFINKYLFNDSAYVLFLDSQDRDVKYKHSIIRQIEALKRQHDAAIDSILHKKEDVPQLQGIIENGSDENDSSVCSKLINYYFVDQALLSGDSYYTAKRQISEILNAPAFKFNGVITIINRLSKYKYEEISNDLLIKNGIYSFNHFFIPPCKSENSDCYLCNQRDFYEKLKKNSVITDCRNIIELNKSKYNKKKYSKEENNEIEEKERVFKRMQWQNRIFYEISNANLLNENIEAKSDHINETFDILFREECTTIDDKIAFLKAISTPPLSDYARIRMVAFNKMLKELKNDVLKLDKKEEDRNYVFNDFILLKVLLKHLAHLGSNALVRKQVIVESWNLYKKVIDNLPQEIMEISKRINRSIKEIENCLKGSTGAITKDDIEDIRDIICPKNRLLDTSISNIIKETIQSIDFLFGSIKGQQQFDFGETTEKRDAINKLKEDIKLLYDINDYIVSDKNEGTIQSDEMIFSELKTRIKNNHSKINQFPKQLLFYIKIATHNDPSKSLWLGELLRTGEEMDVEKYNMGFCVSKTNMYNSLFVNSSIGKDGILLPHLFYDNTTIIRKTLDDFYMEKVHVGGNKYDLRKLFKEKDTTLDYIKENVWNLRKQLVSEYKNKVQDNYYYNWFRMFYVSDDRKSSIKEDISVDGIHLIEKHTIILYAKLLLRRFANQNVKNAPFDKNANHLLEVFAEIMDAQAAYISIKPRGVSRLIHTLSIYYGSDDYFIDKNDITYDDSFYCTQLLDNREPSSIDVAINRGRPFVMRKKLESNGFEYGERFGGKFNRAAYLKLTINQPLRDGSGVVRDETVGLVTFLYGKKQQENIKDNSFIKEKQELGRLLLLLKPELDDYVKHVSAEKMFDVWAEKEHLAMITMVSNHRINLGGWDLDNLPAKYYKTIPNSLIMFSDVTIRHMYALLLNNRGIPYNSNRNRGISLKIVFNDKFMSLLETISETFNQGIRLTVNGAPPDVFFPGTLTILRSYIIQLILNAAKNCRGQKIEIVFSDTGFIIENKLDFPKDRIEVMKSEFENKYNKQAMDKFIESPTPYREYGFTLISLLYYCESVGLKCSLDIDKKEKVFRIKINV